MLNTGHSCQAAAPCAQTATRPAVRAPTHVSAFLGNMDRASLANAWCPSNDRAAPASRLNVLYVSGLCLCTDPGLIADPTAYLLLLLTEGLLLPAQVWCSMPKVG